MRKNGTIIILFLLLFGLVPLCCPTDIQNLKFGYYVDRDMVQHSTIILNEALIQRINEIGSRVAKSSNKSDIHYTFRIINDSTINAYSAAGGFIYINTGLLDVITSEDELAAVLGHEIAHTNEKHQIKFIRAANRRVIAGQILGSVISGVTAGLGQAVAQNMNVDAYTQNMVADQFSALGDMLGGLAGGALTIAMIKGYGKDQELKADALAVQYIQASDYDPYAFINFFQRLISVRDNLGIKPDNYISSLINSEPGLEERLTIMNSLLTKKSKK